MKALLRNYARFAAVRSETLIRSETVLAWAARVSLSPPQRGRRLEVLSIFARHVHAEDPRHEIPPKGVFHACRPSYTPFIYTPAQIGALLARTAQLPPAGSLHPWTYCTLFALLAVTGLRISEALNLHLDDVTADGLLIRETKFHKSRRVPLHPSADAGLERSLRATPGAWGRRRPRLHLRFVERVLRYPVVIATFLAILRAIGLHPGPGQRGPQLHDFRHTWAVRGA